MIEIRRKIALRMSKTFKEEQNKTRCRKWFDKQLRILKLRMVFYENRGFS